MANLRILKPFKFLSKWKTSKTPTWTVLVNQNVSATFSNRLAILHDFAHHKALLLPVRAPTCVTWGRGYPWNTEGAWKTKDLKDVDDLWMCRKRPIQRGWKVDKEGSSNQLMKTWSMYTSKGSSEMAILFWCYVSVRLVAWTFHSTPVLQHPQEFKNSRSFSEMYVL